jgi:hypothetical protein
VGVDVEHGLARVFSGVENQPKIAVGVFGGKVASGCDDFSE